MRNRFFVLLSLLTLISLPACAGSAVSTENQGSRPAIISYTADTTRIIGGNTIWLSWEVEGADSITIDNGVGPVPASGRIEVKPSRITAYNLTAANKKGTIVSAIIINVIPVVQPAVSPVSPPGQEEEHQGPTEGDGHVWYKGAVMVGADGHWITLKNNPAARNPSWSELKAFLQKDNTDKKRYVQGSFTCGDFAEMLHNNAEAAGFKTAIVAVVLKPGYLPEGVIKHSLNAFETADRGTVYIDSTSSAQGLYADKIVDVGVGKDYIPVTIETRQAWSNMGRIEAIEIFHW